MNDWFTVDAIDKDTFVISEYRHWEETHCYLLNGTQRSLLIDTGLGICDISQVTAKLTDRPITAVATHVHWDHIGGHKYYPDFYAHERELEWLNGGFPQSVETVRTYVTERCDLPEGFDINAYEFFQGTPSRVLQGGEALDLGGRCIRVLHTPGHSPGHMCFWEEDRGCLYTGDLIYKDTLAAWFPSTDPQAYLESLELVAQLGARRVCPGHHSLAVAPELVIQVRDAFRQLKEEGKLCHGSGMFDYGDFAVLL